MKEVLGRVFQAKGLEHVQRSEDRRELSMFQKWETALKGREDESRQCQNGKHIPENTVVSANILAFMEKKEMPLNYFWKRWFNQIHRIKRSHGEQC